MRGILLKLVYLVRCGVAGVDRMETEVEGMDDVTSG